MIPHIDTYTLLGYCAGTDFYAELAQLLRQERITPVEGTASEFLQIIDNSSQDRARAKNCQDARRVGA
jgi:hypothetical protein